MKKKILFIADGTGPCAWYRSLAPARRLVEEGHEVKVDTRLVPDALEADVIVLQRQVHPDACRLAQEARSRGVRVVYDLDDDIWSIDPSNPAHRYWSHPSIHQNAEFLLRTCDCVTTTTPPLVKQLSTFNKDVKLIPNMLPDEYWPPIEPAGEKSLLTIGWAGTNTHFKDLKEVVHPLMSLLGRHENVRLLLVGLQQSPFPEHERIEYGQGVPIERYAWLLAQFDIGIAPLWDSRFNRAKSDLKFLEYAMAGVPVVASDVRPYGESIQQGRTGFLASNSKDWLRFLSRLIEDPETRLAVRKSAREYAEERTISGNISLWHRAYGMEG